MTRISEAIKYYESIARKIGVVTIPTPEFKLRCDWLRELLSSDGKMIVETIAYEQRLRDLYLGKPDVYVKIGTLILIKEAIGDIVYTSFTKREYEEDLKFEKNW